MTKEIRLLIALGAFFVLLIIALMWAGNEYNSSHGTASPLYLALSSINEEEPWTRPQALLFPPDSAEDTFLQGMDLWAEGLYDQATSQFHKSLTKSRSDPALPIYAYYYINDCIFRQEGSGSKAAVANALSFMSRYPVAAKDIDLIWNLISTLIPDSAHYKQAIELLLQYLDSAKHLDLYTRAWVTNTIAMLEFNGEGYARSIRRFYDVELMMENALVDEDLLLELVFAREYIANIKFMFQDYEGAAHTYRQLIAAEGAHTDLEQFNCYLNLAATYLKLGETGRARQTMEQLLKNKSRISQDILQEVEASMEDNMALICVQEGDYQQALVHLQRAEAYYKDNEGEIFTDGRTRIILTRCKLMAAQNMLIDCQPLLEKAMLQGEKLPYDLQREGYMQLAEIYSMTGDTDKLIATYKALQKVEAHFTQSMQRAYLEFSEYYRENTQLKKYNAQLRQNNLIAILGIIVISCSLIIISVLLKFLSTKNMTDQLTGVYNRKKLQQLGRIYRRKGTPELFGVVMLDIDYFKLYNDTYGHVAGDQVLKQVAHMLSSSVRNNDYVIRYGGEEFLVLLNKVSQQVAQSICQRIHQQLEGLAISHCTSKATDHVTVSVGLCYQQTGAANSLDKLIQQADQCLYQSKEAG